MVCALLELSTIARNDGGGLGGDGVDNVAKL